MNFEQAGKEIAKKIVNYIDELQNKVAQETSEDVAQSLSARPATREIAQDIGKMILEGLKSKYNKS